MSIRHLVAKLDLDLIARMEAGNAGRNAEPPPAKRQKPLRKAKTYRAARRNECFRVGVSTTWKGAPARYVPARLPTYSVMRFGKWETRPLSYEPNGLRECVRRGRQHAKLRVIAT